MAQKNDADRRRMYEDDPVTGAYNMSAFLVRAKEFRDDQTPEERAGSTIIYLNISTFRIYNDTFGLAQGNVCLKNVYGIIREAFDTPLISRFYADHFLVYYTKPDYISRVTICHEKVLGIESGFRLWLKAGIVTPTDDMPLSSWCDNARIACDAIERKGLDYYRVYTKELSDDLIRRKYIQDNISAAIRRGDVRVYYQPVIRAVTGRLCGMEALARWEDPVYGFLSPGIFVPALEERHLSYLLDIFMVEKICADLKERSDRHQPLVPVSVNFSARDFAVCDPVEVVEDAAERYGINHGLINIEITESAAMEDPDAVQDLIDRFHNAAYQVWMDDFGSAYSSLNTFSRFDFDEIKLDAIFMKNFTERTQKILRQIINMAKELGIHTLAEGVETSEQLTFLRDAGCEKIQGFYYGRPMPLAQTLDQLAAKHIHFEEEIQRSVMERLGLEIFPADQMFIIAAYQENRYQILYVSPAIFNHFSQMGYGLHEKELEEAANSNLTAVGINLHNAGRQASGEKETVSCSVAIGSGSYRFDFRRLMQSGITSLLWITCASISEGSYRDGAGGNAYTGILSNIINVYHSVYRIDPNAGRIQVIRTMFDTEEPGDTIEAFPDPLLSRRVLREDKERFAQETRIDFIRQHLAASPNGYYTTLFRMRYDSGEYLWTEMLVVGIFLGGRPQCLCCLKELSDADLDIRYTLHTTYASTELNATAHADAPSEADLWESLVHEADLQLFWKDKNGHILGASDSYFRDRNITPEEVIGSTDRRIGWHINQSALTLDEQDVLRHGRIISSRPEEYTRGGSVHHTITSRFPIYHEGRIRGIMGYSREEHTPTADRVSETENVMSGIDFLHAFAGYEQGYNTSAEDYSMVILYVPACQYLYTSYGQEAAEGLRRQLFAMADQYLDANAIISVITTDIFVVLSRNTSLEDAAAAWCAHMGSIRSALDHPVRVRGWYGAAHRSRVVSPYQLYTFAFSRLALHDGNYSRLSVEALRLRLEEYSQIFDVVQLVDGRRGRRIAFNKQGYAMDEEACWRAFGGSSMCVNCTALSAIRTRKNTMKLEDYGGSVYMVRCFYIEVNGEPYVIECGQHIDGHLFDDFGDRDSVISRLRELNYEVYTDRLTGIRNRRFYDEQLAESSAQAAAFMDIDNFKHVNDTYGHHAGDLVLKSIVTAVSPVIPSDAFFVRYGGDEFVIIYEQIGGRDELLRSLEQIQENITNIRLRDEENGDQASDGRPQDMPPLKDMRISATIGATCHRGIVRNMILAADRELYRAKAVRKGSLSVDER